MPLARFSTSIPKLAVANRSVKVQPNPFSESTQISISGNLIKRGTLHLFNSIGQVAHQQSFAGNQVSVQSNNLQSGFYMYSIVADNQWIATGKIQLSQE